MNNTACSTDLLAGHETPQKLAFCATSFYLPNPKDLRKTKNMDNFQKFMAAIGSSLAAFVVAFIWQYMIVIGSSVVLPLCGAWILLGQCGIQSTMRYPTAGERWLLFGFAVVIATVFGLFFFSWGALGIYLLAVVAGTFLAVASSK